MFVHLKFLIKWPDQKTCYANMPQIIKVLIPKHAVSLTAQRYLLNVLLHFKARAQTYSHYKKHNTVKYLIAITPNGCISLCHNAGEEDPLTNS